MLVQPLDVDRLRTQFRTATPFPFICIDNFLQRDFAEQLPAAYPRFEDALAMGRSFEAVNERLKVQVTDYDRFPELVKRLADELAAPSFLEQLAQVTGIQDLVWDPTFDGGGLHQTASSGHLDVHVDFNMLKLDGQAPLYRRLNLLLYLNPRWETAWGGRLELWDQSVTECCHAFEPVLNRCVVFETSERSFHAAAPVKCPPGIARKSFAVYYYTKKPPAGWDGKEHSTVFRARPNEPLKQYLLMPAQEARAFARRLVDRAKERIADAVGIRSSKSGS